MGATNIILGLAVLAFFSSVSGIVYKCPEGWLHFQESCYTKERLIDDEIKRNEPHTQAGAKQVCAHFGANLIALDSKEETEFVLSSVFHSAILLASAYVDCKSIPGTFRFECDSGNFYNNDEDQKGYWNWDKRYEPRVFGEQRCIVLKTERLDQERGLIRQADCNRRVFSYGCEMAATKVQ